MATIGGGQEHTFNYHSIQQYYRLSQEDISRQWIIRQVQSQIITVGWHAQIIEENLPSDRWSLVGRGGHSSAPIYSCVMCDESQSKLQTGSEVFDDFFYLQLRFISNIHVLDVVAVSMRVKELQQNHDKLLVKLVVWTLKAE